MRFEFDKKDWPSIEEGEKDCFLLANGRGGYSSLSIIGAAARGDQALLMSARRAPNVRMHLVTNVFEKLIVDGTEHILTSQRMKDGNDHKGFHHLETFVYDDLDEDAPRWTFKVDDVTVTKRIQMVHGRNTVAVRYTIHDSGNKKVSMEILPLLRFTSKKELFDAAQDLGSYVIEDTGVGTCRIEGNDNALYIMTNAALSPVKPHLFGEMYFSQDERDGRDEYGDAFIIHSINGEIGAAGDICVIFSTEALEGSDAIALSDAFRLAEKERREHLVSQAGLTSELAEQLVLSVDAYVVDRDSTAGKSIIAGYPFFEDWGRDTMISLAGATMTTGRMADCKSILRTFARYEENGLLPNLFPEGGEIPRYNSIDAPLLFVNAVYEYIECSNDQSFKEEVLPVLERIVDGYQNGTDFHIKMDEDGLIMGGKGLEQLTWMDVRVGDHLPTPRHGKPVEINAYWYSALMVMYELTQKDGYKGLAEKVRTAFNEKFWNEEEQCLKDVLSGGADEDQIRCNQIWALTMPFTMLPVEKEAAILKKIKEELYTTVGLRTLSKSDPQFHKIYIGRVEERDRAYHQGTVWAFPLGAYYRACIRYVRKCTDPSEKERVSAELAQGFKALKPWLREGCVSQIAEIYDGEEPTVSRGCYAQAWSVAELLRAAAEYERM